MKRTKPEIGDLVKFSRYARSSMDPSGNAVGIVIEKYVHTRNPKLPARMRRKQAVTLLINGKVFKTLEICVEVI